MSSPRRSSPRRAKEDIGKRTGITIPPKGSIPLNAEGFEDLDAFWDSAKSPHPNQQPDTQEDAQEEERDVKRAAERQHKLSSLQQADNATLKEGELSTNSNSSLKKKYGLSTPKNVSNWSNKLLHKAMGVPTEDTPGGATVLSKVSTAPRSAKNIDHEDVEKRGGAKMAMDPPSEEEARGLDPEEVAFDSTNDGFSDGGVDVTSHQSGKSAVSSQLLTASQSVDGKTPDMENSMEEMVDRYEDEYDKEEGAGFELNTQEDVGFDNHYDGFDDEVSALVDLCVVFLLLVAMLLKQHLFGTCIVLHDRSKNKWLHKSQARAVEMKRYDNRFLLCIVHSISNVRSQQLHPHSSSQEHMAKKPRGRPKKDKSKEAVTPTSVLRTKKSKRKKNESKSVNWSTPNGTTGYPVGNREYELHPVSEYKQYYEPGEEPKTPGGTDLRRSKRFRVKPLQYWKNERFVYAAQNEPGALGEAMGDMPVVKDIQRALPTPHKERPKKETTMKNEQKKKKRRRTDDDSDEEDGGPRARVPFDPSQLMKKYKYSNGEHGTVWSEALEDTAELKLVSRLDNRSFSKLPLSADRSKKESKVVGFASQAFHVPTDQDDLFPGYIAGNVVLPPRGIKDAEGVGLCSQVFNVGDCQPGSVEFALADPASQDGEFDPKTAQRYLLSKGDMFQIPPGNVYRIENHSKTDEARLFWTIIKCTSRAEQEQESDEE